MALPLELSTDALRDLLGGRLRSCTRLRKWEFLRSPRDAGSGDVSILGSRISLSDKASCGAGLRIVGPQDPDDTALEVPSPEDALAVLVGYLAQVPIPDDWLVPEEMVNRFGEIARFGRVHRSARIGPGCTLGAGVVVHAGVMIGEGCVLCDHVVLGSPGFGLHRGLHLLPHRAGVVLGDDVFLGPHVNVAAGLIEPTMIGSGSRLDAHIQIGHNARIGRGCVMAGQSGMAGSSELGEECLIGGQAAISDHVRLGNRCVVAAKAGVTKSWGDGIFLRGFPARPGRRV